MNYLVPMGTEAWRSPNDEHGVQFTTAVWHKVTTTKDVLFEEVDRIPTPKYDDAQHYFYFRLPVDALPYRTFIVWRRDVDAFPDDHEINQGYIDFPP